MWRRVLVRAAYLAAFAAMLVPASAGAATGGAEQQLAEKYAPVVGLKQHEPCASTGEPYRPVPVETVLGHPTSCCSGLTARS